MTAPMLDPLLNPFAGWDVRRLLQTQAELRGDHPCLIWATSEGEDRIWSYRDFVQEIARTGAGFAKRGAGDRILVHLDNCPEHCSPGSAAHGSAPWR